MPCCVLPELAVRLGKELGTASGLCKQYCRHALPQKQIAFIPQGAGRCLGVLVLSVQHKWQCGSSSAATCLEHGRSHGLPAASPWHMAGGSWCCCSFSPDVKRWLSKCELEWYTDQNKGVLLAELWGQITLQLWQVLTASCGREEQDASCLVAGVLGRGPAGRQVSWWVRRPEPACGPALFLLLLVVTRKHVGSDQVDSDHSDNPRRNPGLNACPNLALCISGSCLSLQRMC